tara:strand:- start:4536 stop:4733 length:198 start_codon:yes stop_codon:yes gene_type:complete
MKSYKSIKWILNKQIEGGVKALWTWQKGNQEEFNCIYKAYSDKLPIYTPAQLIKLIEYEQNRKNT